MAIVNGNSMYPTLHNGDLVIYHSVPQQNIANGTIIVFVQADTGSVSLDSIVRPVVIHRIIGMVVQADGTDYYKTKGDNNQLADPSLAKSAYVLGTPYLVIPRVGIVFLFIQSPQGLVAIIGFMVLFYLSVYDSKVNEDKKKEKLLTQLAKGVTSGEISTDQFKKFEIAVKYTELEENPLSRKVIDLRPVVSKVKSQGWDVRPAHTVVGKSGISHQFDLAVMSKDEHEKPVVVVDVCVDEKPIEEAKVITMYAKKFDIEPTSAILVSVPSSSAGAQELAKQYGIIMIDAEKPSRVSDIILGATSSLLESYRQMSKSDETGSDRRSFGKYIPSKLRKD